MSTIVEPIWSPKFQSLSSRIWILASFYTVIILAIPFWLKATTIERLHLPRHEVVTWEAQLPCPIRIHQSITLLLSPEIIKPADRFQVADRIQWGLRAAGDGIWEKRHPRKHYVDEEGNEEKEEEELKLETPIPLQYAACIDWDVRLVDQEEHRSVTGLHYEIEFLENYQATSSINSTMTARRINVPLPDKLSPNHNLESEEASFILTSYLAKLFQLPYTPLLSPFNSLSSEIDESPLTSSRSKSLLAEIEKREEDRRRVPYTRNLRLVFSLINEEIASSREGITIDRKLASGIKGWNRMEVDTLFKKQFSPLLHALSGTQTVHTELQTTWFAPLQFQPKLLEVEREIEFVEEHPDIAAQEVLDDEASAELEEQGEVEGLKDLETHAQEADSVSPPLKKVDQYHLIDWEDIKIFVNSGEWSLTSGAVTLPLSSVNATSIGGEEEMNNLFEQNERTLHFILYIPKPSHRPLRVAGNQEATIFSDAKGWLIPQWGGVSLYNLGYEEADSTVSSGSHVLDHLSAIELDSAFVTFEKQFSTLLGMQELRIGSISDDVSLALQLDAMTRRRMISSSRESVKTLGSIIRLVDKIENLGVGESVRDDVSSALSLLEKAKQLMNTTNFDSSHIWSGVTALTPLQKLLDLSHSSELISSRAFFNPNMLGQLYFPDEHKYAVYTPLFGPLAVPLLVAGLRLLKEKRKTDSQERALKLLKST